MRRVTNVAAQDRRASLRHDVKTPLRVRLWKSAVPEQEAQSENISRGGMSFATDLASVVEVLLKMPEEITGETATEWRCTGHVVRVEPREPPNKEKLVGAQFDCYQVSKA
jgi:hypothetical protein